MSACLVAVRLRRVDLYAQQTFLRDSVPPFCLLHRARRGPRLRPLGGRCAGPALCEHWRRAGPRPRRCAVSFRSAHGCSMQGGHLMPSAHTNCPLPSSLCPHCAARGATWPVMSTGLLPAPPGPAPRVLCDSPLSLLSLTCTGWGWACDQPGVWSSQCLPSTGPCLSAPLALFTDESGLSTGR